MDFYKTKEDGHKVNHLLPFWHQSDFLKPEEKTFQPTKLIVTSQIMKLGLLEFFEDAPENNQNYNFQVYVRETSLADIGSLNRRKLDHISY